MSYTVFFGIHSHHVSEARLLEALDQIAQDFDESPQSMLCLLAAPVDGVTWFTFVCSVFRRDAAMSAGFFSDMLGLAGLDFAVQEHHDFLSSDVVFRHYHEGKTDLVVRSDGGEVAITTGNVDPAIPREGDAVVVGLRTLGWSTNPAWKSIGATSRMVVLRKDRAKPERLVIEQRTKSSLKLPPVKVIRGLGEVGFSYWRDHAQERFPLKPVVEAPAKNEIVSLNVLVGKPGVWPDLTNVETIKGRLQVVDSYDETRPDPSAYGLRIVDLGGVRVMKYSSSFYVQGACERIVGKHLEAADSIEFRGSGEQHIELPKLQKLRFGNVTLGQSRELVLPELVEVQKLTLRLPRETCKVMLPKLEKGELVLVVETFDAASVLEIPLLARSNVHVEARDQAQRAQLLAHLGPATVKPETNRPSAKKKAAKSGAKKRS